MTECQLPEESTATSTGPSNCAEVAAPPSPFRPSSPVPANVVMIPSLLIFLILLFRWSAMYNVLVASMAIPVGSFNCALLAGPPSPLCLQKVEMEGKWDAGRDGLVRNRKIHNNQGVC